MSSQLRNVPPCPYCGSRRLRVERYDGDCYVLCDACWATGPTGHTHRAARAAYINRLPEAVAAAEGGEA